MAVEVYKGKGFGYGSERRMLGEFTQELLNRFGRNDDFWIVSEVSANAAAIDLLLISPHAILIVDLKELTAVKNPEAAGRVHLYGKANGPWEYGLPGQKRFPLGGKAKTSNPYDQLKGFRFEFAGWLANHSRSIFGEQRTKNWVLDCTSAWVVLWPGVDKDALQLDLPWDDIREKHDWFRVLPFKELAWEFNCATLRHLDLTRFQIEALLEQLGASPCRLEEVLPVPIPERTGLFTHPPSVEWMLDRTKEREALSAYLDDARLKVFSLSGMGGSGKTWLAGWLADQGISKGYRLYWIDCAEKEVTDETFLAAIASEMDSPRAANFLLDKERYSLDERLNASLDPLTSKPSLLVFNDFHRISRDKGVEKLLTFLVLYARKIKIVLTTRDHALILDHPRWTPGVAKEIKVNGLPLEAIRSFIQADLDQEPTEEQLALVQGRTSGNPYAMRLLLSLARRNGWNDQVRSLPLFRADQTQEAEQWFASLLELLSSHARQFAFRLSVFGTMINADMINRLARNADDARECTAELLQSSILQQADHPDLFYFHEFVQNYLYEKLPNEQKMKTHPIAAGYFARLGEKAANDRRRAEYYALAASHYARAEASSEALNFSELAYTRFFAAGDWDRAQSCAETGLKAAYTLQADEQIAVWLLRIASREIDKDQLLEAEKHLGQALKRTLKIAPGMAGESQAEQQRLEAHIAIQKGRLAYSQSDFALANQHFDRALELARMTQDQRLEADSLMRIGRIERQRGQYERASLHLNEAKDIATRLGDQRLLTESLRLIGLIVRKGGDLVRARALFQQALDLSKETGNRLEYEINIGLLADLARRNGDYAEAAKIFREYLQVCIELGNGKGVRINMGQLAECLVRLGELEEAEHLLTDVGQRCESTGDHIGIAQTLRTQGLLLKARGDIPGGDELIRQGIAQLRVIGNQDYIADFEKDLGQVWFNPGL